MQNMIDWAVDPLNLPSWELDAEVLHEERNGKKYTEITLLIGRKQVYISLRGHHGKARKFKPL